MTKEQEEKAKQLAREHWEYLCKVLKTHNAPTDAIDTIGFHYKTAFIHGFKHGIEYTEDEINHEIEELETSIKARKNVSNDLYGYFIDKDLKNV